MAIFNSYVKLPEGKSHGLSKKNKPKEYPQQQESSGRRSQTVIPYKHGSFLFHDQAMQCIFAPSCPPASPTTTTTASTTTTATTTTTSNTPTSTTSTSTSTTTTN